MKSVKDFDVVVVGGGVVGLTASFYLSKSGKRVCLVDKGEMGREASWAGGGILSPIHPHHYPTPLARLCQQSLELYPGMIREVEAHAGFSVQRRHSGLLRLELGESAEEMSADNLKLLDFHREHKNAFEIAGRERLGALSPHLNPQFGSAIYEPEIHQVRNPRLLKALFMACVNQGVTIYEQRPVLGLLREAENVVGVETSSGPIYGTETVVTAGPWSAQLCKSVLPNLKTEPVHGAMVLINARELNLKQIVIYKGFYLIPRLDGQVLAGSTLEHRGFDKQVKINAVRRLLNSAVELIPALGDCYWQQVWSGLRPSSPDRLPYLGRPDGISGLVVATGHYRNGLLLGPASGIVVSRLINGEDVGVDLTPYRPSRKIIASAD